MDRIIDHLKLPFVAERPPPPHVAYQLAPEVEDPSGWYIGEDGQRVLETIEHFKKIYGVDPGNIVLDGFTRGGYGTMRLALQNKGQFIGVIVRSGRLGRL
ncbi:MAG: hypothetical protein WBC70_01280 [Candidatus Aminicenantales bacterium]